MVAQLGRWQRLICDLCPRGCDLRPGDRGFCFVRENRDGQIVSTTYGRSTGFCIDPIEKKPLNQFFPGTAVLSFGTPGCNLGCTFCQNWTMSRSRNVEAACEQAEPRAIAAAASGTAAAAWPSPTTIRSSGRNTPSTPPGRARAGGQDRGGHVGLHYGHRPPGILRGDGCRQRRPEGLYRAVLQEYCGGRLQPVLDTLRWLVHDSQTWLEITNLVIPGANDSPDDLRRMCQWIAEELGPDVPLHFSAFHPDFKLTDRGPTPPATLRPPTTSPAGRAALCLYGQRFRPRAPAHVLPRLRPGGDPPRRVHGRRV